ncbi:MAG: hypothetical protein SPH94_08425 [Fusobacterium necrophorum]|uniref:hypothetical protein n=1 Tax=Fusobacterium TaxID=848 RepID=UPI00046185D4|nr:hypothetical protein [Fusobacterium necrophorum]KDE74775.1 hypothetical protein FUSO7_00920 [Fusobacterium necrophorum BFTR-2]MDY2573579.1 hypothetical protein [Fusobacterium necrophorum]MDY6173194.1 hypothetical protein [Fusobacterium necrophorum]RXZ26605.1 hypothetical protein EPT55_08510 [Fusobacterium necrophorum]
MAREFKDISFFKQVKKTLVDLDMTFSELREQTSYKTDCGLRYALKGNNPKAIDEVQKILCLN